MTPISMPAHRTAEVKRDTRETRILVRLDLAQPHIALDFPAVKLAIELGAAGGNFLLGLLLDLRAGDGGLAARDIQQFGCPVGSAATGVPGQQPDGAKAGGRADAKRQRERPGRGTALRNHQGEVGGAC